MVRGPAKIAVARLTAVMARQLEKKRRRLAAPRRPVRKCCPLIVAGRRILCRNTAIDLDVTEHHTQLRPDVIAVASPQIDNEIDTGGLRWPVSLKLPLVCARQNTPNSRAAAMSMRFAVARTSE